MEYPIETSKKGLFVIIRQQTHRLKFDPSPAKTRDWGTRSQLNYEPDEKRIIKEFGLKQETEGSVWLRGIDLENTETKDKSRCFDSFMEKVCEKRRPDPQFIMFFLMSHGFEDGMFLLASQGRMEEASLDGQGQTKLVSQEQCCSGRKKHSLKDSCFARHISHDIIHKLNARCRNASVPKIIVIQTCRGGKELNLEGLPGSPLATTSATELFIVDQPDTLVFRASVEGYLSYVAAGSLLIQSFCDAVSELRRTNKSYYDLLQTIGEKNAAVVTHFRERREDMTGGWMMNICQRATALVTNQLLVKHLIETKSPLGRLLAEPKEINHQQKAEIEQKFCDGLASSEFATASKKMLRDACHGSKDLAWLMYSYVWSKVRLLQPKKHLDETRLAPYKKYLDELITAIRATVPLAKQQPHISSSLAMKVSCIKILTTQGRQL